MSEREAGKPKTRSHATYHSRTREAHATELAEDYVEAIAALLAEKEQARVVDLAARFGVSHAAVIRTVGRLQREGLVETEPYKSIFLTARGRKLAERSRERHEAVVRFLLALGVSADAAHADAEGIEHHVSAETLRAFERFVRERAGEQGV